MTDAAAPATTLPTVTDVLGEAVLQSPALAGSPLADGLTEFVIPRPGDSLTRTVHSRVYQALVPVTTRSFGADMTPYWAQRSQEGYLERLAEFVLIADDDGAIVGWTGYHRLAFDDFTIIYLDSTGMVPAWQSSGCMRRLMHRRIALSAIPECAPGLPIYLTARTESPIFYRLMRGLVDPSQLYPQPGGAAPDDIRACAVALAGWLGQAAILDAPSLTLRGAYDTLDELYGELPSTGDAALDTMFREHLGPLDAYLVIGRARRDG